MAMDIPCHTVIASTMPITPSFKHNMLPEPSSIRKSDLASKNNDDDDDEDGESQDGPVHALISSFKWACLLMMNPKSFLYTRLRIVSSVVYSIICSSVRPSTKEKYVVFVKD